jgi:carboxymethylenebutenolidase
MLPPTGLCMRHYWAAAAIAGVACSHAVQTADHDHVPVPAMSGVRADDRALPAGATAVSARLLASPRHGEWVMIRTGPSDSVRAWVEYPERATKAPVVVVVHEIFGLSTWVRGVADQLAADGYIAIAPDLLTGKGGALEGDTLPYAAATAAIRTLAVDDVQRQLAAVGSYGMSLPAALPRYGIVGFCWGGGTSFEHAVRSPTGLAGAVVYYGSSPDTTRLSLVRVPVLGLYAGEDERINARVPATDSVMKRLHEPYDVHTFPGAGHGFLRAQEGREANAAAARGAWPLTIAFFRKTLGA